MTERKIRDGQTFNYASEHSCATIGYLNSHWFYVELNGVCVYTSYTFRPAKKILDKLIEKYGLVEETKIEE